MMVDRRGSLAGMLVMSKLAVADTIMGGKAMLAAMRQDPKLKTIPAILMSAARRPIAVPVGEDFPEFSTVLQKPFLLKPLMVALAAAIASGT